MKKNRLITPFTLSISILAIPLLVAFWKASTSLQINPNSNAKVIQDVKKPRMPLAYYNAPQTQNHLDPSLRRKRNNRFDNSSSFRFEERRGGAISVNKHWWIGLSALPINQSDAVILGTVTDAKGYLSNDKTGAYSEFQIKIENIVKKDEHIPDDLATVDREGATVVLPDGYSIDSSVAGQNMPQVGHRYVLFLKYDIEAEIYSILTGYELSNGKVTPLDTIEIFQVYKGYDEDTFLKLLQ